jgi:hypothetical protein
MAPTKYIERRALKGMARPNDGYSIGIAIKMTAPVVGSLSSGLSTRSHTPTSGRFLTNESQTALSEG